MAEDKDEPDNAVNPDDDNKEGAKDENDGDEKKEDNEEPKEEEDKKEGDDGNQIDSNALPKPEDEPAVDERGEEYHEQYDDQAVGDSSSAPNPYENDEPLMLEINSKSKSKCLRKVILEKKNLEGSQILLFK